MSSADVTYFEGIERALERATIKSDRTSTGTHSAHCINLHYYVRGFLVPILQSKKLIYTKSVINSSMFKELKWYLLGSGSNKDLIESGVKFWSEWATKDNHLGPIYGFQWRKWPAMLTNFDNKQRVPNYYGVELPSATKEQIEQCYNEMICMLGGETDDPFLLAWCTIIEKSRTHGYTMDPAWLSYDVFLHDIRYMVGYHNIVKNVFVKDRWQLCSEYFNCKHFSKNTCAFIPRNDFYFEYQESPSLYVMRPQLYHDQFSTLIDTMKADPFSRRLIINSWNVGMLDQMQLPPCHFTFQFLNKQVDGITYTSLSLIMRSNDVCLGHPFNIAQYSMLLFIVCKLCGTQPDMLFFHGGDFHIYKNHLELLKDQQEYYHSEDFTQVPLVRMRFECGDVSQVNYYRFDFVDDLKIKFEDEQFLSVQRPHFKYPVAV